MYAGFVSFIVDQPPPAADIVAIAPAAENGAAGRTDSTFASLRPRDQKVCGRLLRRWIRVELSPEYAGPPAYRPGRITV
jgi:hypothetical protein